MKKIIVVMVVLFSGLFLSGCAPQLRGETVNATVTKSGTLTMKVENEYLLKTDSEIVNITSNKINLDNYLKSKISVTGQFSGSTLYVDSITN
ncbi:hypothetical protein CO009_03970 [Candidatus Shapirobacteria bacterium CG_4_8_14_3_um_filter_35_11]|uniref:Auto-transporter adhesin head GIN domain-containing protein n=5 Tax=Candidatus Shapironibacteriota TaxID=1752721 RepID=A0A1J5I6P4_9BACT|nr:MAG: hypothetical protein AUK05_02610 [Candidatus Shapirobacteria bacterium CG2_30_35_20]PIV07607.1 MAG: hypothetical protein COS53_01515 [Candidatus Shapirobacteria bacterium CG03_land_8_20_14_0_80_35_14]PIX67795.1 MAG: hypothetical protein COZ41_03080 [Candidatus Shapirobacteria bacterium CG_4_10_14_3_um_filter_35_13]PJC79678.1 MAG: hypothetical protein CO009_03970 [Candidatus Shapirobacteria bacterium CG_4_8_14_3_um_filter_35_11]PJE66747.1 MAG: hypothetical protein COU93_02600 [Candidatus